MSVGKKEQERERGSGKTGSETRETHVNDTLCTLGPPSSAPFSFAVPFVLSFFAFVGVTAVPLAVVDATAADSFADEEEAAAAAGRLLCRVLCFACLCVFRAKMFKRKQKSGILLVTTFCCTCANRLQLPFSLQSFLFVCCMLVCMCSRAPSL